MGLPLRLCNLTPLLLVFSIGAARLHAQNTVQVAIIGTVRDTGGAPLAAAVVDIPALHMRVHADSTGRFRISLRARPGCYELVARQIGFGPTVQAVRLHRGLKEIDAGQLPLQPAPGIESDAFVVGECQPNARSRYATGGFAPTRHDSLQ